MIKITGKFDINGSKTSTRSFDKMTVADETQITASNARGFLNKYKTLLNNATAISGKLIKYTETEVTFE